MSITSTEPLKWIDTHLHLDHKHGFNTEEYLRNANMQGVFEFITIGTTPESLKEVQQIAHQYPNIYFSVGIHPHEAKEFTHAVAQDMNLLRKDPKCVAIGEIGLDYHYNHSEVAVQKSVLEIQLEMALKWSLPVVIHAREAEDDLISSFKKYVKKCTLKQGPGIIHCFSGTPNFARVCLELGFYLSFSGIVTFKTAGQLRDIVKETPLERILIETDSPFLAPVPYRGKPNQSAYMIETAKIIAQIKEIPLSELSRATVQNSRTAFNLPTT